MPLLRIRLLGQFTLSLDDAPGPHLTTPRYHSFLAFLILHPGTVHSRRQLAFRFWPDSTEKQAYNNLRKLFYRLRSAWPDVGEWVHTDELDVQWRPREEVWIDVHVFQEAIASADEAERAGDLSSSITHLQRAANLYSGPLLPNCYDEWIFPLREQLEQDYTQVLDRLSSRLEGRRAYREALQVTQRLVQHDPLQEHVYRRLMRLHTLNGDRALALRAYHRCASVLQQELGVDPGPATQSLYEQIMERSVPAPTATLAPFAAGAKPLVGRVTEWARLRKVWQEALLGRARLVLIAGEAGIGKTRLAEELLAVVARQGYASATARAYAAEGELAFAPLVSWLRARPLEVESVWRQELARILPELDQERPTALPGIVEPWQRRRLFEALRQALLRGREPLLLLLDDLHWCDPDTLQWLHFALRTGQSAPVLFLATIRVEEINEHPAVQSLLSSLQQQNLLLQVDLAPLSRDETAALTANLLGETPSSGLIDRLHEQSEGNPLFLVEWLQSAQEGMGWSAALERIPPQVQAVIQGRLAALSPPARKVVDLAAVIGHEWDLPLLAAAIDLSEATLIESLDELWRKRLIREQGRTAYEFTHDKIREVTYDELPPTYRRWLHRRVGAALAAQYPDERARENGRIAVHFERGVWLEQAIRAYQQAARVARERYAYAETSAILKHLLEGDLAQLLSRRERCDLLLEQAAVLEATGEWVAAEELLGEAVAAADAIGEQALQVRARLALANVLRLRGEYGEALARLQEAEERLAAGDGVESDMLGHVLLIKAEIFLFLGQQEQARVILEQQIELARTVGDQGRHARAATSLAFLLWTQRRLEEALTWAEEARSVAERAGERAAAATAAHTLGNILGSLGRLEEAFTTYHRAYEESRVVGERRVQLWASGGVALLYARRGEWSRARAWFHHNLQLGLEMDDRWSTSNVLAALAVCEWHLAHPGLANRLFETALALGRRANTPAYLLGVLYHTAEFLESQGNFQAALSLVEETHTLPPGHGLAPLVPGETITWQLPLLHERLLWRLGNLSPEAARTLWSERLAAREEHSERAALHHALWQLDRQESDREASIALYRALWEESYHAGYKRSWEELTGKSLPGPPPLPDLSSPSPASTIHLSALLARVNEWLAVEMRSGATPD